MEGGGGNREKKRINRGTRKRGGERHMMSDRGKNTEEERERHRTRGGGKETKG